MWRDLRKLMKINTAKLLEILTPYGPWKMWRRGGVSLWQVVLFYIGLLASLAAFAGVGLIPLHGVKVAEFVLANMAMFSVLCGCCDDLLGQRTTRQKLWFKFWMTPFMAAALFFSLGWAQVLTGPGGSEEGARLIILGIPVDRQGRDWPMYLALTSLVGAGYVGRWLVMLRVLCASRT